MEHATKGENGQCERVKMRMQYHHTIKTLNHGKKLSMICSSMHHICGLLGDFEVDISAMFYFGFWFIRVTVMRRSGNAHIYSGACVRRIGFWLRRNEFGHKAPIFAKYQLLPMNENNIFSSN